MAFPPFLGVGVIFSVTLDLFLLIQALDSIQNPIRFIKHFPFFSESSEMTLTNSSLGPKLSEISLPDVRTLDRLESMQRWWHGETLRMVGGCQMKPDYEILFLLHLDGMHTRKDAHSECF